MNNETHSGTWLESDLAAALEDARALKRITQVETIWNLAGEPGGPFRVFCYITEGYATDGDGGVEEVICWHITRESFFAVGRDVTAPISCEIEELEDGRWRWMVNGVEGVAENHHEARDALPWPVNELSRAGRRLVLRREGSGP